MKLGGAWIFNTFFKDKLIHEMYRKLDDSMTSRWPDAWQRFLRFSSNSLAAILTIALGIGGAVLPLAQTFSDAGHPEIAEWLRYAGSVVGASLIVVHAVLARALYEEARDEDGFLDDPDAPKPELPKLGELGELVHNIAKPKPGSQPVDPADPAGPRG